MVTSIGWSIARDVTSAHGIFSSPPAALNVSVPPASELATPVIRSPFFQANFVGVRRHGRDEKEEAEGERSHHAAVECRRVFAVIFDVRRAVPAFWVLRAAGPGSVDCTHPRS
jgi:hypothetical protein